MYKNYLFDLDGTLLPMDMQNFTEHYFKSLCKKVVPVIGVDPRLLVKGILSGLNTMTVNDGTKKNCDVFWRAASEQCGTNLMQYSELFDEYYKNEFEYAKRATQVTPYAIKSIEYIKSHNGRLIAATNPIFPKTATYRRLEWAGVSPEDFEYITVYDNSSFCKPNPKYFEEICKKCGISPYESIMIGNDVDEDMCASELGFDTYLITDCIINRSNKSYSEFKHGSFENFYDFLTNRAQR
ncbi:MAG: HAD family hydrolase [Clostridia bacterium]|nr:HAD family hydrolase [Clostridia bacterium]